MAQGTGAWPVATILVNRTLLRPSPERLRPILGLGAGVGRTARRDTLCAVHKVGPKIDPDYAFRWRVRVYYEDTDAGGVVYYANYLKFFERCRTEWLRSLGAGQFDLAHDQGLQFVVTEIDARFRLPARLDDELTIEARVTRLAHCFLVFEQRARRGPDHLADARVKVACIDRRDRRPARLPAAICPEIRASARETQAGAAPRSLDYGPR
jgi:acyl-CoA thioester hydrolase